MRKKRTDTVAGEIEIFQNAHTQIDLPEGVTLNGDDELIIWRQMTALRTKDAWRDFDLILLAKIVKLEAEIRKIQETIRVEGHLILNARGTPIENPLFRVVDTLQRQQLAIIRSMSLNQTESDPRTLNAQGMKQQDALKTMGEFGIDSLIAMPNQH